MNGHRIQLIGNLGGEVEMRYTPDGTPVANFSVAVNRRWTDGAGAQKEETTWFRVTAWRRLAETCNEYLSKGRQVYVEGRLTPDDNGGPRVWAGSDGQARASFELTAESVRFLGGNGSNGASAPQQQAAPVQFPEDEIPF